MAQQKGRFLDPDARSIRVEEDTDIQYVAREAKCLAGGVGLSAREATSVEIAVSELASNLRRHAGWGMIDLKTLRFPSGFEVTARDWGPGISDLQEALENPETDGTSLGIGLSGVQRLMDEIEIESSPESGTLIRARKWPGLSAKAQFAVTIEYRIMLSGFPCTIAVAGRPRPGYAVSGDSYVVRTQGGLLLMALIDGLGHGPGAHEIGQTAADFLRAQRPLLPGELLSNLHERLRGTRGAVAGLALIDPEQGTLRFVGAGNIAIRISGPAKSRRPITLPGLLGHNLRTIREEILPLSPGETIVIHSDGISDRFDLGEGPLRKLDCLPLAKELMERFERKSDDALVLVARCGERG